MLCICSVLLLAKVSGSFLRTTSFHVIWSRLESFLVLFPGQLLVQSGHVVVPLGLVAGPGHRGPQVVFLPEALQLELATAVSGAVGEDGLGAGQAAGLLVHQPHIPVQT